MIKPLPNPDFLSELLRCLRSARRSIIIINYLAELPSEDTNRKSRRPVFEILNALIEAKRRQVKVSVLLEGSRFEVNYHFYRMLKDNGVDAWLDTSKTFIHHKIVIVDGRLIFLGSHNLTPASLGNSEESSIVTDDRATIRRFIWEIKKVTKQRDSVRGLVCRDVINLPDCFIKDVAAPMFRAHAENAFDLYMIFCLLDGGRPRVIPIDWEGWGKLLGFNPAKARSDISKKYRRYFYTQRTNRILGQLCKNFGLIRIDRKADTVIRLPLSMGERVFAVPKTYWKYGWPGKFSFVAKYFYLISVWETFDSPYYPWWKRPVRDICKRYGCDAGILKGARELEDYNILEILRAIPVKRGGSYSQEAQFYRINPFYK
jgi:hypothetical protein